MLRLSHGLPKTRTAIVAAACLVLASGLLASGCGSTKVYTADKTVQHRGTIYNVSEVKRLSSRLETVPADGNPVDLTNYDSKKFDALVKEQGPTGVRSLIVLDDGELVYEQKTLEKGRDFERMQDELADAFKKVSRFMADAKKTQLEL
jgi:hypothetical protein